MPALGILKNPDEDNNVKIQGYNDVPTGNPAPGQFTTYKSNALEVTVPGSSYFGIHLDVSRLLWICDSDL